MESGTKNGRLLPILKCMGGGVIACDVRGCITFVNPLAESMTGLTRKQMMGRNLRETVTLCDAVTGTPLRIPTTKTLQKSRRPQHFWHVKLKGAEGSPVTTVDAVLALLKGYRGSIKGYIIVFYDIGELLEREHEELDRRKIEAIGHIAGNVANSFQDWLGIVAGHASAIADNLIPKTRAHEEATRMLDATKMLGKISNQLQSIGRASDDSIKTRIKPVPVADAVRRSVNSLNAVIGEEKIEFKIRNPDQMPYVMADAGQLLDCLMNLLLNSVEAMPDGGTITIDTVIKIDGNKDFVVLRVRDTGCGMTKDVMDRIYEPFFTTKKRGSALGLGLTVVQSLVQQWNGYVKARSQPGHGASFRVFIPRARIRVSKDAKKTVRVGAETILLVDDNENVLAGAKSILRDAGYRVFAAGNGEECISLYKRHMAEINLSIIDVVMPGKGGKEVLERILELDPTAHIIMTSGFSRDYVRSHLERGAWGFVQKPYEERHLLSVVRGVLDRKVAHKI